MLTSAKERASTLRKRVTGVFYGYIIVLVGLILMLVVFGTVYSYGVFFKPMSNEFQWNATVTSGAYSLSILVYGCLVIIAGKLSDRFGPKVVGIGCGVLQSAGLILMSQVNSIWQLYLFYGVLVGAGISGWWIALISVVANWFVKRRGMMVGLVASGIGLGTLLVPPIISRLISSYGWRTAFAIAGAGVLLFTLTITHFLKRSPREMGLAPYGNDEVDKENRYAPPDGVPLRDAIRRRQFWMLFGAHFCYGYVLYSIMVHIAPHGIELGMSTTQAADILAIIGLAGFAGRFILGTVGDRIGNLRSLVLTFAIMSFSLALLLSGVEFWIFLVFSAAFGFAYAGLAALLSLATAEMFGTASLGIILGTLTLGFTFGGTIGPLIAGIIFDVYSSYQIAFFICLLLSMAGLVVSILLHRKIRHVKNR